MSHTNNDNPAAVELTVRLDGSDLCVSFHHAGVANDSGEIADRVEYFRDRVETSAAKIMAVLRSPQAGCSDAGPVLRQCGLELYGLLITAKIKTALRSAAVVPAGQADAPPRLLRLLVDASLDFVPWELLYDGEEFLCRQFAMGRAVENRRQGPAASSNAGRGRVLILSDPQGNLSAAQREGPLVKSVYVLERDWDITLRNRPTTVAEARTLLMQCDVFHFAGHSFLDADAGGFRFSDGNLTASDLRALAGSASMPRLVVANSCESAESSEFGVQSSEKAGTLAGPSDVARFAVANASGSVHPSSYILHPSTKSSLAHAFLACGVELFVGSFGKPLDEDSAVFGCQLHRELLAGRTIGEAVHRARAAVVGRPGGAGHQLAWANYVLYGDPAARLVEAQNAPAAGVSASAATGTTLPAPCGVCGRIIEHDYGIGHRCEADGCGRPICRRCRREEIRHCGEHAIPVVPAVVVPTTPTVDELLMADAFVERVRQAVERMGEIREPHGGKAIKLKTRQLWLYSPSAKDAGPLTELLRRFVQIRQAVCYSLGGYDPFTKKRFRPECRLIAVYWQPARDPAADLPALADVLPLWNAMKESVGSEKKGCILMLASPGGWAESLTATFAGSEQDGACFVHPQLALVLNDAGRLTSVFNPRDLRLAPLREMFDLETRDEKAARARGWAIEALVSREHVCARDAIVELNIPAECVEAGFRLAAAGSGVTLRDVAGLGLVLRRD